MPVIHDLDVVRAILDRDRAWAAYAIGDLAPSFVAHCEWYVPAGDASGLVLLYRGFNPPIVFAMGDTVVLAPLFSELRTSEISLHVQAEPLAALSERYAPTSVQPMVRMQLEPAAFRPVEIGDVRPIGEADLDAITALFEEGHARGQGPTHFTPAMIRQGTFRGVWDAGALVAIAGSHLYSRELGVCTIGNVYTRSDHRRRGLAARVTAAVIAQALADHIPTIVLNVSRENVTAKRVYERLGFTAYCEFFEGTARRRR